MTPKTKTRESRGVVDQGIIKALTHPMRVDILDILNERVASPNELAKELSEGLSQVSYHVKVLKDYQCIELVRTEPRRGAVEHYYRAIKRPMLSDADWEQLPESVRSGLSATLLKRAVDDAWKAINAGTLDARDDRHMSWTPMIVDEQGWQDVATELEESLERIFDIQAESAGRLAEAGKEGVSVSVAMMGFETPAPEDAAKKTD